MTGVQTCALPISELENVETVESDTIEIENLVNANANTNTNGTIEV